MAEDRLSEILDLMMDLASGNLESRKPIKGDGGMEDAIIEGMNMLGESLLDTMVSKDIAVENQRLLDRMFNLSLDFVCVASFDGFFEKINPIFSATLGFGEEELLGKPFLSFVHQDDVNDTLKEVEKLSDGQTTINFTNRYLAKNGDEIWLQWNAVADTENEKIFAVARNITKSRAQEKELETSERKYRELVENSFALISTHDMTGQLLTINKNAAIALGYAPEVMLGQQIQNFLPGFARKNFELYLKELEAKGEAKGVMAINTKDGLKYWSYRNKVIERDNEQVVLGFAQDISDRIKLERELKESKIEAERLARVKHEFLANMSHEIRTPLNAIIGFAQLLDKGELTPAQRDHLEAIKYSGENLLSIINDILDFSKLEAGKMTIISQPFNLHHLLNNLEGIYGGLAKQKGIDFVIDKQDQLPQWVNGDVGRINQVLINLIGNAVKFTSKGHVRLSVSANIQDELASIKFKLEDTGIGIPEEELKTVFESFTQANSRDTNQLEGTGLGLSIVSKLAALLGGKVSIESTVNKGTTAFFELTLRLSEETGTQQSASKSAKPDNLKGLRVLLAEDNLLNQKLALKVLRDEGIKADLAENGEQAVKLAQSNQYDLILMDIQMPLMDGISATKAIRMQEKSPPIIALTAHALTEEKDKCLDAGMNDYLSKPFKINDLLNTMAGLTSSANQEKSNSFEHFDFGYLKDLAGEDTAFTQEILNTILSDLPTTQKTMSKAIAEKDWTEASRLAHKLKGSLSIVGFKKVIKALNEIESEGRKPSPKPTVFDHANQELKAYIPTGLKEIQTYLSGL